jgi:DNA replication protein DnaC
MDLFDRLCSVDLLHIDDLGAEKRTEWVLEQLYAIVNERYENGKALMLTTNLDIGALTQQISERTVSRLVEICGDPLMLFGSDRRIEARMSPPELRAEA